MVHEIPLADNPTAQYQSVQALQTLEKMYAEGAELVSSGEWKDAAGYEGKSKDNAFNILRKQLMSQGLINEIPGPIGGDARKKYYKPTSRIRAETP